MAPTRAPRGHTLTDDFTPWAAGGLAPLRLWQGLRSARPPAHEEVRDDRVNQPGLTNPYIAECPWSASVETRARTSLAPRHACRRTIPSVRPARRARVGMGHDRSRSFHRHDSSCSCRHGMWHANRAWVARDRSAMSRASSITARRRSWQRAVLMPSGSGRRASTTAVTARGDRRVVHFPAGLHTHGCAEVPGGISRALEDDRVARREPRER
jgi:hypothetical protein